MSAQVTPVSADVVLALDAPEPIIRYCESRLLALECEVTRVDPSEDKKAATILSVRAPTASLEPVAEALQLEKPLQPAADRSWSEREHPYRIFKCADRASFVRAGEVPFTPAERAMLLSTILEKQLVTEDGWPAALAAAGHDGHVERHKLLLFALTQCGFLQSAWPAHTVMRRESVGVPLTQAHRVNWAAYAHGLLMRQHALVCTDRIRAYWGEATAFYFAWQVCMHIPCTHRAHTVMLHGHDPPASAPCGSCTTSSGSLSSVPLASVRGGLGQTG